MTDTTKKYRKKAVGYTATSWVLVWVIAAFLIIYGLATTTGNPAIREQVGTIVYGMGMSLLPVAVLAIIVKDRIKPVLWTLNIILTAYVFGAGAMYVCAAIWAIDTYLISLLAAYYRGKYSINVEIDKRTENEGNYDARDS